MGPREKSFRQRLDILDDASLEIAQKANAGVAPIIHRLRLEDALDEALAEWSITLDCLAAGTPGPGILRDDRATIARLRGLLAPREGGA